MERPEIVIGLVGAVGTDLQPVCDALEQALAEVSYSSSLIRLSELLPAAPFPFQVPFDESSYEARLNSYMDAGNKWRKSTERGDAVALLGIGKIRDERLNRSGPEGSVEI